MSSTVAAVPADATAVVVAPNNGTTTSSTSPTGPTTGGCARSLAQEVVSWYLHQLDPLDPHAVNVGHFLRDPVIALTVCSLTPSSSQRGEGNKNTNTKGAVASSECEWREYLHLQDDHPTIVSLEQLFRSDKIHAQLKTLNVRHCVRMEAFLRGVSLAVESPTQNPTLVQRAPSGDSGESLSLVEGLVGFKGVSSTANTTPQTTWVKKPKKSNSMRASSFSIRKHPQISEANLVTRLELYLRSLHRSCTLQKECALSQEPARSLKARVRYIVAAFIATVGTVHHVSPVLTRLLTALTQELLAVQILSESLKRLIRTIVSSYVHTTSFASLAFLSSPEIAAEQRLVPAITKYLVFLQKNCESLESECHMEHMLETSLDREMRHTFKTAEFQSIGHLLEVCQTFRDDLQAIVLLQNDDDAMVAEDAISQALKDLQREVIAVNGSILPYVSNRADLVQLLTSSLSTRPFYDGTLRRRTKKKKSKKKKSSASRVGYSSTEDDRSETDTNLTSGNEGDLSSSESSIVTESRSTSRGKFKVSTVDLLTKRLLVAASRTGTGGDAYFVVRDLFGGEDVEVVPSSTQQPHPHHAPTVDLIVRLASVTIKSYSSFDVYPTSLVGDCEPLIQLHTTVTETIALQEVRSGDNTTILQERLTDNKRGTRTLAVRPALYEKSPVWQAPS